MPQQNKQLTMKIIYAVIFLVLINACNADSNGSTAGDSTPQTMVLHTPEIISQTYTGTLPCADCVGIDVSLQLNSDSGYVMNSFYKGGKADSSNNPLKETGIWRLSEKETLYLVTGNHTTKYLKTDSTLTQLDGDGNVITGSLAPMFVLPKK